MLETIKKTLLEYCEPKLDGMSAHEISSIIVQRLHDEEAEQLGEDYEKGGQNANI